MSSNYLNILVNKLFNTLLVCFISITYINDVCATNEDFLRTELLKDYNKYTRPVINDSNTIDIKMGIDIKGLESFNQKDETAVFNIWMTIMWYDDYLYWNKTTYNLEYINVDSELIWKPDIELYNSASKAKRYNINNKVLLKSDGHVLWTKPVSFAFACPLQLSEFPRDTQTCSMTFGSWSFPESKVLITPFDYQIDTDFFKSNEIYLTGKMEETLEEYYDYEYDYDYDYEYDYDYWYDYEYDYDEEYEDDEDDEEYDYDEEYEDDEDDEERSRKSIGKTKINKSNDNHIENNIDSKIIKYKNISISSTFTHNEWNIKEYNCSYTSEVYKCCPGDRWSVITFKLSISRNSEKYDLTIINIIVLTFSALFINIIDNRNYNRTFILIFIPLSVIWVLISISNKLPVVDYFTKMDKMLILTFIICEICTFISGIIYSLNNSDYFIRNRYECKDRPINKYKLNAHQNMTLIVKAGLQDIINKVFKIEKKQLTFKEKRKEVKSQITFIKFKKIVYSFDILIQFSIIIGYISAVYVIYYD